MIGYIAAAKSFEESNIESIHSFTYNELRNSVSSNEFTELVDGNYRQTMYTDPSAFKEQLPFYKIRPVYSGLVFLLYKAGVNTIFATHIISGVAVAIAIAILYFMADSFLAKPFIYVLPLLAIIFGIFDLARFSTPDGLAFLFVILSAYLYLVKRFTPLLILLPFMIGVRTDLILYTTPLLIYILAIDGNNRWKVLLSLLASAVIYIGIGRHYENTGWSTVFSFSLINRITHPISMPSSLTLDQYLFALTNGVKSLTGNKAALLNIFIATYSIYRLTNISKTVSAHTAFKSTPAVLTIVCSCFMVSHFLAFPVLWDRFFSGPWMVCAFSLLLIMTNNSAISNDPKTTGWT